ncbi:MAG: hypothetical protein ACE5JG_09725 [Planctomycetota bacterium]
MAAARTSTVFIAGLLGGMLGASLTLLLQPEPDGPPPARAAQGPDADRLLDRITTLIDERLAERQASLDTGGAEAPAARTAPATRPAAPSFTPAARPGRDTVERLRHRESARPAGRRTLELPDPTATALMRRFLLRSYTEVLEEVGFPHETSVGQGSVVWSYRYRTSTGAVTKLQLQFRDGVVVALFP